MEEEKKEEKKESPEELAKLEEKRRQQQNNPLHGVTRRTMLEALTKEYTWEELHELVPINCFAKNPSVKSSLTFLRKTPWALEKVEEIYLGMLHDQKSSWRRK